MSSNDLDINNDNNNANEGEIKKDEVPNNGESDKMATCDAEVTVPDTIMQESPTASGDYPPNAVVKSEYNDFNGLSKNNDINTDNVNLLNSEKIRVQESQITTSAMEVVNNNDNSSHIPTTMKNNNGVITVDQEQYQEQEQEKPKSVLVPFTEFAEDVDLRLGRANGNVYHRRAGIPGVNDGQIMVRLKKKRFIVIDYGIVPTINDIASASMNAHVTCPPGAGKQICGNTTPKCNKIGVPVLLYDSDPEQPHSLYMRSGLCFTCQRLLNEKRRTQRKRKSDTGTTPVALPPQQLQTSSSPRPMMSSNIPQDSNHPRGVNGNNMDVTSTDIHAFSMDSAAKRFRLNGEILDLAPDAIIINGPLVGTKHQGPDYGYMDIGNDLLNITKESFEEFQKLVSAVTKNNTNNSMATSTADASNAIVTDGNSKNINDDNNLKNDKDTCNIKQEQQKMTTVQPTTSIDNYAVLSHYEKTFLSMSKGIFLLSQWKASWDLMTAAAAANAVSPPSMMMEQPHPSNNIIKSPPSPDLTSSNVIATDIDSNTNNVPPPVMTTLPDSALLASAAAVAAAQSVVTDAMPTENHHQMTQPTTDTSSNNVENNNMVPLLLAAQSKNDNNVNQQNTIKDSEAGNAVSTTKIFGV